MKEWKSAFPVFLDGTPVIRTPNPLSRSITTSGERKTVVEMNDITNPVKMNLTHPEDTVIFNRLPNADIGINLKKGHNPNIKYDYLASGESPPVLQQSRPDYDWYLFSNGKKLIIAHDS